MCVANKCVGTGALTFTMTWDKSGDMDLHLLTPCNKEIYYSSSARTNCGGFLDVDVQSGGGPENIFFKDTYMPGKRNALMSKSLDT